MDVMSSMDILAMRDTKSESEKRDFTATTVFSPFSNKLGSEQNIKITSPQASYSLSHLVSSNST